MRLIFLAMSVAILHGQVVVEPDSAKKETVYRITDGACQIRWTVFHSELNAGIIQHRATCSLPLGQQLSLTAKLLEKVLADQPSESFRTLSLGRLDSFPGMTAQLAKLAKQSPQWDLQKGQPKSGKMSEFVVALANQGQLLEEWQAMFARFHRKVKVSGVERVSVSKAADLPNFKQLKEAGIDAADKVPYDCEMWLSVTQN